MVKNKLVLIKWIDSKGGSPEWEFLDEIENLEPVICESVGFLIDDKKTYKTLAPTMGGGQIWGRITIPSCAIVKLEVPNMHIADTQQTDEREIANYPVGRGLKARILISGASPVTGDSIEKLIKLLELNKEDLPETIPNEKSEPTEGEALLSP